MPIAAADLDAVLGLVDEQLDRTVVVADEDVDVTVVVDVTEGGAAGHGWALEDRASPSADVFEAYVAEVARWRRMAAIPEFRY